MSGNPKFEVIGHEHGIPVRPRSLFPDVAVFARDSSATVLVLADVASQLREAAAHARPAEVGGLLVGRQFRDDAGPYVAVLGCVQAPASDGRQDRIQLSPDGVAALRQQAAARFPSMDVIGWWHSHAEPSQFSMVDRQSQRLWGQRTHVGLLVFAQGKPWAYAYLGPQAIELPPVTDPINKVVSSSLAGALGTPVPGLDLFVPRWRRRMWRRRPQREGNPERDIEKSPGRRDDARRAPIAEVERLNWLLVYAVVALVVAVVLLALAVARLAGV